MKHSFAAGLVLSLALGAYSRADDLPAHPLSQAQERLRPAPSPDSGPADFPRDPSLPRAADPAPAGQDGPAASARPEDKGEDPAPLPEPSSPTGRWWGQLEYLHWWIKDSPLPPLLTTGTPQSLGLLGFRGTQVLVGGSPVDNGSRSGGRLTGGYWFDCDQTCGIEATILFLDERAARFGQASRGVPLLARPFFNIQAGEPDAEQVANPLIADLLPTFGGVRVAVTSSLYGWELNGVRKLSCGSDYRLDLVGGFRYLRLDEGVEIFERVEIGPNPIFPDLAGTRFNLLDTFYTRNDFYGAQAGCRYELCYAPWFVQLRALLAIGGTHQTADIDGATLARPPRGRADRFIGGLLALPSNIGHYDRNKLAVVPELGLNLGYQVTSHLRASIGYTYLYWNNVARPGDQIDLAVDPSQLPPNGFRGEKRPAFPFEGTSFHAHGFNFALEYRY